MNTKVALIGIISLIFFGIIIAGFILLEKPEQETKYYVVIKSDNAYYSDITTNPSEYDLVVASYRTEEDAKYSENWMTFEIAWDSVNKNNNKEELINGFYTYLTTYQGW